MSKTSAGTHAERILKLASKEGVIRPRSLERQGIARAHLSRLCERGLLTRIGRGLYARSGADLSEHHTLAEACTRVPRGVICLMSALRFHDVGTQLPHEVWMALDEKARKPAPDYPPLRTVRFSGAALGKGVEKHTVDGVTVRVYSVAKTVADCFKYRNKIGLDVCLEALKESLRERRCTREELRHFATVCRVWNVMRPYLEALS